ncbi:NADH dehydrogenase [ubiquinone] 1 beta subcomplex subunit 2, mitochondrial-like [Coccinella septempunctata]|uniref:NADH dehydrogenase [ubiquinone] 1 beta subcomplex subunit 2, mitochondrial-like n=1 Tax=Coccinella septempunctata TaxID=41139 RepID=UPI001D063304|nr:NADH dehydrogenase [ubiquinone] 1 beta subcomplex subunit 2, mitochondrial-like [Coccinella septempunctata]
MILSRALPAFRAAKLLSNNNICKNITQISRNSHEWYYRSGAPPNPQLVFAAEIGMGMAWWWFLWHLWTEPEHLYGEFPCPDPKKWTDEELGIPA